MVTDVSLLVANASLNMLVTEFGMVTDVSCLLLNAPVKILVTSTQFIVLGMIRSLVHVLVYELIVVELNPKQFAGVHSDTSGYGVCIST